MLAARKRGMAAGCGVIVSVYLPTQHMHNCPWPRGRTGELNGNASVLEAVSAILCTAEGLQHAISCAWLDPTA